METVCINDRINASCLSWVSSAGHHSSNLRHASWASSTGLQLKQGRFSRYAIDAMSNVHISRVMLKFSTGLKPSILFYLQPAVVNFSKCQFPVSLQMACWVLRAAVIDAHGTGGSKKSNRDPCPRGSPWFSVMGKQIESDATNEQNHDFRKSISERTTKLSVMKAVSHEEKSI